MNEINKKNVLKVSIAIVHVRLNYRCHGADKRLPVEKTIAQSKPRKNEEEEIWFLQKFNKNSQRKMAKPRLQNANSEETEAVNDWIKLAMRIGVSSALHPFEYAKVLIQVIFNAEIFINSTLKFGFGWYISESQSFQSKFPSELGIFWWYPDRI